MVPTVPAIISARMTAVETRATIGVVSPAGMKPTSTVEPSATVESTSTSMATPLGKNRIGPADRKRPHDSAKHSNKCEFLHFQSPSGAFC